MTKDAPVTLAEKMLRWAQDPCCDVPLDRESKLCVWHGYRSLHQALAALIPQAAQVEGQAQINALQFFRDTTLKDARTVARTHSVEADMLMEKVITQLDQLVEQIQERL
jgi:hypothetical protein